MVDELRRQKIIDPSTADLLEDLEKKNSEQRLPPHVRARKTKEKEKAKSRLPRRVNWEIPQELKKWIVDFSENERIPASQVVAFLLIDELNRLSLEASSSKVKPNQYTKEVLRPYKIPSNSPRYDWNLSLPKLR